MSDIVVRDLAAGELEALAYLYGGSFDEPYPAPVAESLLMTPGAWCEIAISGESGLPAGFVIARLILDEAEILSIGTLPEMRRRGVGRALVAAALARAGRSGATVVHLEVGEDNPAAVALYGEFGFRQVGRRAGYYRRADRSRVAALLMSYTIESDQ